MTPLSGAGHPTYRIIGGFVYLSPAMIEPAPQSRGAGAGATAVAHAGPAQVQAPVAAQAERMAADGEPGTASGSPRRGGRVL